jgi:hypothetical protein
MNHSVERGSGGAGGTGYTIMGAYKSNSLAPKAGSIEKLYKCAYSFYVYPNGEVEIAKNRWQDIKGNVDIEELVPIFSKILADLKLKDTNLDMFKEGLSELLQEAIKPILEGNYYERTVRSKSTGNGS